jgi:hypothetical protein
MLRHSLYKKFGKKFQPGGKKTETATATATPGSEFKAPAPFGNYTTMEQPQGTITTQDASFAPGVFSNDQASNQFTSTSAPFMSNMLSENVFDVNQQTPQMEQGPLTQQETKDRGILPPAETPSVKPKNGMLEDLKDNWSNYATLGLAGVSGGLNYLDDQRRQQELQQSIQQRDSKPVYDYNWMYGRTTSGGTEYQPIIMAQNGANLTPRYGQGGMSSTNVEIEGGEFLILPDGTTELAKGPSHSRGGIDTVLPEGTKVFSNHLRPMDLHKMPIESKQMLLGGYMQDGGDVGDLGLDYLEDMIGESKSKGKDSKKTFADIAKRYDLSQYQKVLDNPFAPAADKQTAQLMLVRNAKILDQLFRDQQILNGNSTGEPMDEMKNGGLNNPGFKSLPAEVQHKILSNMQKGGKYKIPQGANVVSEADLAKANPGDYVQFADGTVKKLTSKDVKTIDKGFNKDFSVMKQRWDDPKLNPVKDQMWSNYVKENPNAKISKEQYLDNYIKTQEQLYAIDAAAEKDPSIDLSNPEWDRTAGGAKNKRYKDLVKKLGLTELNEDQIKQFQQGYRDLAAIQTDPQYKEALADFDLAPKGVGDQNYLGKPISGADEIMGNTTIRELQRLKATEQVPTYGYEDVPLEPEPTPEGQDYNMSTTGRGPGYKGLPYDIRQDIPAAYGLAQSQEIFPYAIPEVDAPYIRPQTLNIQSQLQDADNNAIAAMRYGADPNLAYIAGLDSKQKSFENKQNYDADARAKTDMYNAEAKFKADAMNAGMFNSVYNDLYAGAKSAQSEEKQKAISALTTNRAKYNQDENLKKFYFNNFANNYSFDGTNPDLTMDASGTNRFSITGVKSGSPTTTPTTTTSPTTTQQTTPSQTTSPQQTTTPNAPMRTSLNSNLPLSMQYGINNPAIPELENSFVPKSSLNPNLPLSMQYGPVPNNPTEVNLLNLPKSMGGAGALSTTFKMGGEMDNYLNPFKKKKGFRKK